MNGACEEVSTEILNVNGHVGPIGPHPRRQGAVVVGDACDVLDRCCNAIEVAT